MSENVDRRNVESNGVKTSGGVRLLSPLERTTRALKTLSLGNRTLLRAANEMRLLHDMSALAVELCGYRAAGVVYAEHDHSKRLSWMVWISMFNGRPKALDVTQLNESGLSWDDSERGDAAVGVAIRTNAPCIGRSLVSDPVYLRPQYSALRELSTDNQVKSVTALPLAYDGNVIGALFFSAGEPDAFDVDELSLLTDLADDLAFGISALRMREQRRLDRDTIERLAFFDPYTGLPNRTRLLKHAAEAIEQAQSSATPLTVLHLKIDRFEDINQTLGYHAVETLIKELITRLMPEVKEGQTLARVSEDSLGLIAPNCNQNEALALARSLLKTLDEPIDVCGVVIDLSILIGAALYHAPSDETIGPEALLRRARAAVHLRTSAYTPVAIYTGHLEQENMSRLELMGDLRRAVERDELQLYCQPKIDIRSGRVLGAEALVRWRHPLRGMISPSRFIKLAEQSGMISTLTSWMLDAASEQLSSWQKIGMSQSLAINISAHDLHNSGITSQIEEMVLVTGICPEHIQFEITESALIDDPDAALEALARLKRLGVSILIDDFGTGYSSLGYLQKFPVDGIKIDQSFVMPMLSSLDSAIIVHSTIDLGHRLGLEVIAEGVETQAVWENLMRYGCDVAQGYLVAMPMPVDQFKVWMDTWVREHDRGGS